MNIKKFFTSNLSKKNTILVYFIFFIFLNIFDFLNLLSNDFDFFKKLLSWGLIIYFFYKISFSKILIGTREKTYDILFLIFFSFISIPKSLLLHLHNLGSYSSIVSSHSIFHLILAPLKNSINDFTLLIFFIAGIIGIIITSISLISNKTIKKPSLIASLNIKENYFKILRLILITISVSLFFGIIIFNMFMEWFALAVDSLILVLGLIYYIIKYIKDHSKSNFAPLLNDISNSGNSFFQKIIENLSDKKTFSITIALFITLHLIVDAGVYLIPYLIGTQNQLYFQQLNTLGTEHTPIFNFFNASNSQLYNDFEIISIFEKNEGINLWFLKFQALLIHISFLFLYLTLLISPFYLFYKTVNKSKIIIPKWFNILFLSILFLSFTITILSLASTEYNAVNKPISYNQINSYIITGVDLHTSSIFKENTIITNEKIIMIPLLFLIILFLILIRYDKYEFFWKKLSLIFILLFTIYYAALFGTSIISKEIKSVSSDFNFQNLVINPTYSSLYLKLEEKISQETIFKTNTNNLEITSQIISFQNTNYLHTKIKKINPTINLGIENQETKIFKFTDQIYYIENSNEISYFEILQHSRIRLITDINGDLSFYNLNENSIQEIRNIHYINQISTLKNDRARLLLERISEYLRLIFTLIYFITGIIAFTIIFLKEILFENKNTKVKKKKNKFI